MADRSRHQGGRKGPNGQPGRHQGGAREVEKEQLDSLDAPGRQERTNWTAPPCCLPGCPNRPFLPPWCLAGCPKWSFPASLVLPWCLTGCPISPFLPPWCLPGASQAVQMVLSCFPGASQAVQMVLSCPWCFPGCPIGPFLSPWCLPGCPIGPFLPPWCLAGCPINPVLPPWCLPARKKEDVWPDRQSCPASLVPPRLSTWSFPASLVPPWCLAGCPTRPFRFPGASQAVQMVLSRLPGASQAVQMVLSCLPGASQPCLGRLLESSGLFGLLAPPGVSEWSFNGAWLSPG